MDKKFTITILLLISIWMVGSGFAQEKEEVLEVAETSQGKVSFSLGADLVSRNIWRGQDYGKSAAIQPTFALDAFGFSIGAWGSYGLSRYTYWVDDTTSVEDNYTELDLFICYTYKYFTLMLTDYYIPIPIDTLPGADYFNWKNQTTCHTLELSLILDGPEKFPVQFIAATALYGADKGKDSTGIYGYGAENNFSTYFEISYQFSIKGFGIKPFIGGIPFGSYWYGPKAGINNIGINVSKEIPISRKFSLPLQSNLVFNPLSKKAYLVFILSL